MKVINAGYECINDEDFKKSITEDREDCKNLL